METTLNFTVSMYQRDSKWQIDRRALEILWNSLTFFLLTRFFLADGIVKCLLKSKVNYCMIGLSFIYEQKLEKLGTLRKMLPIFFLFFVAAWKISVDCSSVLATQQRLADLSSWAKKTPGTLLQKMVGTELGNQEIYLLLTHF